ncbi:MAG: conjugal transfer protein TraN, partial [Aquamicrobium sp.]|nr:conjugal transfer protein TraN [Aquamicrobium sp.]
MPGDLEVTYDYRAIPPPVVVTSRDESVCNALAGDADCTAQGDEVCTDNDPVTRTIDGVAVTQPCWAWQRNFSCASGEVVHGTPASDCQQLEDMGCTWQREECLTGETPCLTTEVVYKCPLPAQENPEPAYICDGDVYCIHGECDTIERESQTGFQDALVALNSVAQAGQEFNEDTLTVFTGDALACTKLVFGVKNCCVPRGFP